MGFVLLSSWLMLLTFELSIVGMFLFNLNKQKKTFISWSGWWDCGSCACFLILQGKHGTHKCYAKEANYELPEVECDLGGRGQRERNKQAAAFIKTSESLPKACMKLQVLGRTEYKIQASQNTETSV